MPSESNRAAFVFSGVHISTKKKLPGKEEEPGSKASDDRGGKQSGLNEHVVFGRDNQYRALYRSLKLKENTIPHRK